MHPKAAGAESTDAESGEGEDEDHVVPDPGPGFIPPHIYASTYSTYSTGGFMDAFINGNGQGVEGGGGIGSMVSGRGHTLKGRDALKARTAILRQTGFVEPDRSPRTPGGELELEPRTTTPAIVVAGDVAGREGVEERSP